MKSKQDKFRIEAKHRLLVRKLSIKDVADQIGHPRSTVSQAINHDRFPNVRKKLQEALAL